MGHRLRPGVPGGVADLARLIQQRGPAVDLPGQPVDDRVHALGPQRGPGQPALGGEGAADLLVLLGGQQLADGLADRDERRLARHLQQRQPGPLGGGHERGRRLLVRDPDTEAETRHATGDEPGDIVGLVAFHPQAGGQQQLPALQVWCRVRELADRHPAHRGLQHPGRRGSGQRPEVHAAHDGLQRRRHAIVIHSGKDEVLQCDISTYRS